MRVIKREVEAVGTRHSHSPHVFGSVTRALVGQPAQLAAAAAVDVDEALARWCRGLECP